MRKDYKFLLLWILWGSLAGAILALIYAAQLPQRTEQKTPYLVYTRHLGSEQVASVKIDLNLGYVTVNNGTKSCEFRLYANQLQDLARAVDEVPYQRIIQNRQEQVTGTLYRISYYTTSYGYTDSDLQQIPPLRLADSYFEEFIGQRCAVSTLTPTSSLSKGN